MDYHNPQLPSNLYTAGAERFDTRQLGQMLMYQQRQRHMAAAKQDADLQKQYSGEVGKLLGVDRPGAVDRYQKWKGIAMKLNSDEGLKKDPVAFANAQEELGKARAAYDEWVGNGAQRHDFIKYQQTLKPEDRNDNHGSRLSAYMSTPMDKLNQYDENGQKVDLGNYDSYIHTDPNYDMAKFQKNILGEKITSEGDAVPMDKNGIQYNVPVYEHFGNNPAQVYHNVMMGAAGDHATSKMLGTLGSKLTDKDFADMDAKYSSIPNDEWKKRGLKGPVQIPLNPNASTIEKTARYMAQQSMVDNPVVLKENKPRTDERRKMDYQMGLSKQLLDKKFAQQKALIQDRKNVSTVEAKGTIDGMVSDIIGEAKKNPIDMTTTTEQGGKVVSSKKTTSYNMPMSEEVAKAGMLPGQRTPPNAMRYIVEDGKEYVKPIRYKQIVSPQGFVTGYVHKDGKPVVDESHAAKIPIKQFKEKLAKEWYSGKILKNEIGQMTDSVYGEPETDVMPTEQTTGQADNQIESLRSKYNY